MQVFGGRANFESFEQLMREDLDRHPVLILRHFIIFSYRYFVA